MNILSVLRGVYSHISLIFPNMNCYDYIAEQSVSEAVGRRPKLGDKYTPRK